MCSVCCVVCAGNTPLVGGFTKNFLQIMHRYRKNHWIVASTILSHLKVTVYNFIFDSIDANTIGAIVWAHSRGGGKQ